MATDQHTSGHFADRELVTSRDINAPRELVFRALRDPERLGRWWGPAGFRSTSHEFEFRVGARWLVTLHGPDGTDYPNEYIWREIAEPEQVVISHPDPQHSFDLTISLTPEGAQTRVEWRMRFDSAAHCAEVKEFVNAANEQVLDRLEAEVATIS